jgi:hypothetical protein
MNTGKEWKFKYISHGSKVNIICSTIDFTLHTLDTDMRLLSNPSFFSTRNKIRDYSVSALVKMVRYLYRMLAHTFFHHKKLFDLLEDRYSIGERLTFYCKKFKIIDNPKEYCIKI